MSPDVLLVAVTFAGASTVAGGVAAGLRWMIKTAVQQAVESQINSRLDRVDERLRILCQRFEHHEHAHAKQADALERQGLEPPDGGWGS